VAHGEGLFLRFSARTGRYIRWFSYIYCAGMIVRYGLTMFLHPERRWFSGTIPIWFHFVLAAFLYTYSRVIEIEIPAKRITNRDP
jgi:hypothetical protein